MSDDETKAGRQAGRRGAQAWRATETRAQSVVELW